jgi:hypothetical protein
MDARGAIKKTYKFVQNMTGFYKNVFLYQFKKTLIKFRTFNFKQVIDWDRFIHQNGDELPILLRKLLFSVKIR